MTAIQQIAKIIRDTRLERGWTQQELANRSGWHVKNISRLENGRHNITLEKLEELARALELEEIILKIKKG